MPPREPSLVHPRPLAQAFFGREAELTFLRRSWSGGFRGVLALIGLGGAGKTAVSACFADEVRQAIDLPKQQLDDLHALDLVEEAIFHALEAGRTERPGGYSTTCRAVCVTSAGSLGR